MAKRSKQAKRSCPYETTVDIISGKWKVGILLFLYQNPRRFGEIQAHLPGITQRMLSLQLKNLEAEKMIHRQLLGLTKETYEYTLSAFGESLIPILQSIEIWGRHYNCEQGIGN